MKLTRRYFLKSTGALLAYASLCPYDLLGNAGKTAADVKRHKSLVVIFLRGGLDGLNFIVPHGEQAYYDYRENLAIARPGRENGALELDGFFGLHPAAEALHPLLMKGEATALHAVGYDKNTRSHFEEQDTWETGVVGETINSDGWLNRHLLTSEGHGPIRALSVGDTLPRILHGKANAFAIRGLSELTVPTKNPMQAQAMHAALAHAYEAQAPKDDMQNAGELLSQSTHVTLEAMEHLNRVAEQDYKPKSEYPDNQLGRRMQTVARLLKAKIGLEVVEVTYGGWDTHNEQGSTNGTYPYKCRELAEALAAFRRDMGDAMEDTLVLTLSDFGRTARENGTGGTDHGWANCLLAMGGSVPKVRTRSDAPVHTDWPGLAEEQLNDGRDLAHTIDFRNVIAEAVHHHLGNPNLKTILPGHTFEQVGYLL